MTSTSNLLRLADQALRAGRVLEAWRLGEEGAATGVENAGLFLLAAYHWIDRGDFVMAQQRAARAVELAPRDGEALNVLGLSLARQGRHAEALKLYDQAIRNVPALMVAHFNKGCALEDMGDVVRARGAFERANDLAPGRPEPLAHLASLAVGRGDLRAAKAYAVRLLRIAPQDPVAAMALAAAEIEERKFAEAARRLTPLTNAPSLAPMRRAMAYGLLGDALDGEDKTGDAFTAYRASKAIIEAISRPAREGWETPWARLDRLTHAIGAEREWRGVAPPDDGRNPRTHVFLVGFPRSGTTLLEQILAGHPDIETMEERDCLRDSIEAFVDPASGFDRLAKLSVEDAAFYRDSYWKRAEEGGARRNRPVFVDKMPLNSALLFVIAKLFPSARILFALRDPRDVVLSCFRRRLTLFELATLDGAARYYGGVMRLADACRDRTSLAIHDIRLESLIADLQGEMGAVCAFLGIPYTAQMEGFAARVRERTINTPSAAQVARGLNAQGVGQWRRYRAQLEPVLPILEPWVRRFGYAAD